MKHSGSYQCTRLALELDLAVGDAIGSECSHCSRKGYLLWFTAREHLDGRSF